MGPEDNSKRTHAERTVNERMAALGRRSGEARRTRKAEPTDQEKAHSTLVSSLESPSAIARIQAAKELLSRKPEPEPEPDVERHGVNLADVIAIAINSGVEIGELGRQVREAAGRFPPPTPAPATPPAGFGHVPPAERLAGVPAVGGPAPLSNQNGNVAAAIDLHNEQLERRRVAEELGLEGDGG